MAGSVSRFLRALGASALAAWAGCGGNVATTDGGSLPACHDDRRTSATSFVRTGTDCILPGDCRPEGGPVTCVAGLCVYASCNGKNEDQACTMPGGAPGTCCQGTCGPMTPPSGVPSSHDNCGGCGSVCPADSTCDNAGLCSPGCPSQPCPAGLMCLTIPAFAGQPAACVHASCSSQPDGTRCFGPAVPPNAPKNDIGGNCCGGQCVDSTIDNANCGGCGIKCCAGTQCSSAGVGIVSLCL